MKSRIIPFFAILFFLLAAVNCKQIISPFSPNQEAENQADNGRAGQDISAKNQTKETKPVKGGNEAADFRRDPDLRKSSPINRRHSGRYVTQKGVSQAASDTADIGFDTVGMQKKDKKKNKNKGNSDPVEENENEEQELYVQIQPDKWNINWAHSEGLVTVRIRGEGIGNIDPDSLCLIGPEGDEICGPVMTKTKGSSVMAKFLKKDAINLIPDPAPGELYEMQVSGEFSEGDGFGPLSCAVTVVGKKSKDEDEEEGELSLEIEPDEWDISWAESTGFTADDDEGEDMVVARITGEGFESIDLGSVSMGYGPCEGSESAASITPESEEMGDDAYVARFTRSAAIGLIGELEAGETHEIHVSGTLSGTESFCLSASITLVSEEAEGELSLKIKPDKWNLAWANDEDGEEDEDDEDEEENMVRAIISGDRFDEIDPDTIEISGPEGSTVDEMETEFEEDSFIVKFSKKKAIALIPDPEKGYHYSIFVSGSLTDGTSFALSDSIEIKGKKKD